ncbi:hypothetical protein ACIBI9_29440 [Nonomuraea sp. NPDC050451]|uniref:hypothetical protein n=1 Tax=Nonomuraea sp. NPDC050451 TaxID=3364364 RepID=UPI00379D941D
MIIQTEQLLTLEVPEDRIYIDCGFSGTTRRNRASLDQALAAVWDFIVTNCPHPPGAPSAVDTPRARCPWPT